MFSDHFGEKVFGKNIAVTEGIIFLFKKRNPPVHSAMVAHTLDEEGREKTVYFPSLGPLGCDKEFMLPSGIQTDRDFEGLMFLIAGLHGLKLEKLQGRGYLAYRLIK